MLMFPLLEKKKLDNAGIRNSEATRNEETLFPNPSLFSACADRMRARAWDWFHRRRAQLPARGTRIAVLEPSKARGPTVTAFGRLTDSNGQPSKAQLPMEVTESGTSNVFNELQPKKAQKGMHVTEFESVKLTNDEQWLKEASPIEVTESGIVKLTSELQ